VRRFSILARLAALVFLAVAAGCSERIEGGEGCPELCPTENVPVKDTTLDAVVFDTVLSGYPGPGEQALFLLAAQPRPDTAEVRAVVRFDSLPARYFPAGAADSVQITQVDSGFITLHLDTTGTLLSGAATISAYDVDTVGVTNDTSAAVLNRLFRPDRLIGAVTIDSTTLKTDSLRVPISNAAIAAKARDTLRLRIGLRISSAAAVRLRVVSSQGGATTNPVRLSFDPKTATDTTYSPIVLTPSSGTPAGDKEAALGFRDFTVVAAGTVPSFGADLVVGGLPARRTFVRLSVPSRFVDSATIVRATLLLNQRPVPGASAADTVDLTTDVVVADQSVADLRRSIDLSAAGASFGVDSLRMSPADSGLRSLGLVNLVRAWRSFPATTQRALVLRARLEGAQVSALRFISAEESSTLRPRVRISYIPRTEFALP
jgi:hypothetical protein